MSLRTSSRSFSIIRLPVHLSWDMVCIWQMATVRTACECICHSPSDPYIELRRIRFTASTTCLRVYVCFTRFASTMALAASTYAKSLSYLCHGHPLWIPEPCGGKEILIGDVGYILDGGFYRFFNVTRPQDDTVNSRGVPPNFEVLSLDASEEGIHHVEGLIPAGSVLCSRKVRQAEICASAAA